MDGFSKILSEIKVKVELISEKHFEKYTQDAVSDGLKLISKYQDDLAQWTEELMEGKMTKAEFEFLLKQKQDISELETLNQKKLPEIRLKRFHEDILDSIARLARKYS